MKCTVLIIGGIVNVNVNVNHCIDGDGVNAGDTPSSHSFLALNLQRPSQKLEDKRQRRCMTIWMKQNTTSSKSEVSLS